MGARRRSAPGDTAVFAVGGGSWESLGFPSVADLAARVRFREGRIELDGVRLHLLHHDALAALRQELLDTIGTEKARGIFARVGYLAGASDARMARHMRPDADLRDAFIVGPQLHAFEGLVRIELVELDMDVERGSFRGEFIWHESAEADLHVAAYGISQSPACWMQTGYACGFATTFMGRPILWRELMCRAKGDPVCRLQGRPAEAWEDAAEDLAPFRSEAFVSLVDQAPKPPAKTRLAPLPKHEPLKSGEPVGVSPGFVSAAHKVRQVADTQASVLFLGETGVGKERFARLLHGASDRADGPFVALNCGAIPEGLVEAELFGVERGAFTGATHARSGKFQRADGGTLFLDEVGLLSPPAQAKLLRVLQERVVERVGGEETIPVDVRVVAATNLELEQEVANRRFRADLYYRLSVFPIWIPPLRQRRDDIPALAAHFLELYRRTHRRAVTGLTERALRVLLDYEFPGNVRELENMIERAVIVAPRDGAIDVDHLLIPLHKVGPHFSVAPDGRLRRVDPAELPDDAVDPVGAAFDTLLERAVDGTVSYDDLERELLERAVARADGNLAAAARALGMTRRQLAYRLHERTRD